jgi:predicted HicB family RNase H-like nuclease
MADATHYTYRVAWSAEDQEHVATVLEFPSLSWLESDSDAAFKGIRQLVAETVADLEASGEEVPAPLAERSYSGRFNLRVPPVLHCKLAMEAAEEHVSLNSLVVRKLVATA